MYLYMACHRAKFYTYCIHPRTNTHTHTHSGTQKPVHLRLLELKLVVQREKERDREEWIWNKKGHVEHRLCRVYSEACSLGTGETRTKA